VDGRLSPDMKHTPPPLQTSLIPRHELDSVVANVELTMISIVQGVALYFLADNARPLFVELRLSALPYVVSGLLIIFTVWSRSVIHAFTVIRWPLELGHNFFYIGVTLVETALFSQSNAPARWYPLSVVLGLIFWIMFYYEQRMYRLRLGDSAGPQGTQLLAVLEKDHRLSMTTLVPLNLAIWIGFAVLVWRAPDVFVEKGFHVVLGTLQALGLLVYLALVWRFYHGISNLILAARAESEPLRP